MIYDGARTRLGRCERRFSLFSFHRRFIFFLDLLGSHLVTSLETDDSTDPTEMTDSTDSLLSFDVQLPGRMPGSRQARLDSCPPAPAAA
jgi:hypothetical protein